MLQRPLANGGGGIAQRTEFVFLILEEVGIDGPRADAKAPLQLLHFGHVVHAVGQIPKHMQRHCGRGAGQAIHFGGVRKFLFDRGCRRGLHKLAEARTGVGESPGRDFDMEAVQRLERNFVNVRI